MAQSFFSIDPVDISPGRTWEDINVSSYVPAGATGVILHLINTSDNIRSVGLRKKGSLDDRTEGLPQTCHCWAMIGLDSNRIFQAEGHPGDILIYLVGYTKAGVTFFTNAYDKSPEITGSWQTIDCSVECPGAIGLIFEVQADIYEWYYFGLRKYGSTDNRYFPGLQGHSSFTTIIGCDELQRVQSYIENPVVKLFLVGYVTDGAAFYTNALEVTPSLLSTWLDLASLPADTNMGFFEVNMSGGGGYGLRKNGSLENIRYGGRHQWAIVGCDGGGVTEGYITGSRSTFFVIGYSERVPLGIGTLNITSIPSMASVFINGEFFGTTPYSVILEEGRYEVILKLDGYEDYTITTDILPDETTSLDIPLTPITEKGVLSIMSTPSNANAYLDGLSIGTTPLEVEIETGAYTILVTKEGYENYTTTVEILADETTTIEAILTPAPLEKGILSIASAPVGADIYLNGILIGITPIELEVDPGSYEVLIRLTGYYDYTETVEVITDQITYVTATLAPLPLEKGILSITSAPVGADIYLNNILIGITPIELEVDPGSYEVLLTLTGYEPYVTIAEVFSAETTPVDVTLTPLPAEKGTLTVTSSPTGADAYLNGLFVGATPLELLLDPGIYGVLLTLLDYQDYTATIEVIEGETTPLHATLTPTPPLKKIPLLLPIAAVGALGLIILATKKKKL